MVKYDIDLEQEETGVKNSSALVSEAAADLKSEAESNWVCLKMQECSPVGKPDPPQAKSKLVINA